MSQRNRLVKMLQFAGPTRGGNRNCNAVGYSPSHLQVIARASTIGILAGKQYLTGTQRLRLPGPLNRIKASSFFAGADNYLKTRATG